MEHDEFKKYVNDILKGGYALFQTGSRYICDPPVTNTDADYFIWVLNFRISDVIDKFKSEGFKEEGSEDYDLEQSDFKSLRRDNVNVLLSSDIEFMTLFRRATEVCKELNVTDKDKRIMVFRAFLYNETP